MFAIAGTEFWSGFIRVMDLLEQTVTIYKTVITMLSGSLETRSDSPVSRTTNQSPLSIISTTSTNSDLVPDRPPPPYPGPSAPYPGGKPLSTNATATPDSSEISELEQVRQSAGQSTSLNTGYWGKLE